MAKRRTKPAKRDFTLAQARERSRALTIAFVHSGVITTTEDLIFAGSLRRRAEVVKDLDVLLVDVDDDHWARLEEVTGLALSSFGPAKAQGVFEGIQVDVRRVACESVGAALEYFTGPRAHNIGMRAKAKRQGLKLNEYGLYNKAGARIAGRTERGIYDALDHEMKAPAMRSNPPGDIWDLHTGSAWVVVPTNGVIRKDGRAVMGAGLAQQAAKRFPDLPYELGERLRLAKLSYPDDPMRWNKPFRFDQFRIFTFPTKFSYRQNADLSLIEASAKQLARMIVNYSAVGDRRPLFVRQAQQREKISTGVPFTHECPVFLPHVGAGLGGLDWADVEPIIHKYLGSLVTIVPPPAPAKKRARKKATRLTKPTRRPAVRTNPPIPETWDDPVTKWVWPVVDRNWAAIKRVLDPFGEADWDKLLGCGAMGCVVPFVDDDRLVAKITTDDTEGTVVQAIIESGLDKKLDGLPRYLGVWRLTVPKGLPTKVPRRGDKVRCAYLIVREDVEPWGEVGAGVYVALLARQGVIKIPRNKARRNPETLIPWYKALVNVQRMGLQENWDLFHENLDILDGFPEVAMLSQAMRRLSEHGIILTDQHIDNLGTRVFSWPRGQKVHMVTWADGRRRPPLLSLDAGQGYLLDRDEYNCRLVPRAP